MYNFITALWHHLVLGLLRFVVSGRSCIPMAAQHKEQKMLCGQNWATVSSRLRSCEVDFYAKLFFRLKWLAPLYFSNFVIC
jgi:hypothetical protein